MMIADERKYGIKYTSIDMHVYTNARARASKQQQIKRKSQKQGI